MIRLREYPISAEEKSALQQWLNSSGAAVARKVAASQLARVQAEICKAATDAVAAPGAVRDFEAALDQVAVWKHFLQALGSLPRIETLTEPYLYYE